MFQHMNTGWIYVVGPGSMGYTDSLVNFSTDLGQAYPGLPDGYTFRIYDPANSIHILGSLAGITNQTIPWSDGDTYIAALPELLAAKQARQAVLPPTVDQAQTTQLHVLDSQAAALYLGGVQSMASGQSLWYDTDQATQDTIAGIYVDAITGVMNNNTYTDGKPAGIVTLRAKQSQTDPDSAKVEVDLNSLQTIMLRNDLKIMISKVKSQLWKLQEQVYAAYAAGNVAGIQQVSF